MHDVNMTSSAGNSSFNGFSKYLCFKCTSSADDAFTAQQQIYLGDHFTRSWTRDQRSASKDSPDSPDMQVPNSRSQSHQSVCHTRQQPAPITRTRSSIRDTRGRKNWATKAALQGVSIEQIQEWKLSFDNLLQSPIGSKLFRVFLTNEIAEENLLFWEAVEELKKMKAEKRMQKLSRSIYDDFISVYSPREINIGYRMRESIVEQLLSSDYMDPNAYRDAQNQIYGLMLRDSYPRFLASALAAKEKQESTKRKHKEAKSPPRTKSRVLCCYGSDPDEDRSSPEAAKRSVDDMKVLEQVDETNVTRSPNHNITVQPPGVVATPEKSRDEKTTTDNSKKNHCDVSDDIIDPAKIPGSPRHSQAAVDVLKDPEPSGTTSGDGSPTPPNDEPTK